MRKISLTTKLKDKNLEVVRFSTFGAVGFFPLSDEQVDELSPQEKKIVLQQMHAPSYSSK